MRLVWTLALLLLPTAGAVLAADPPEFPAQPRNEDCVDTPLWADVCGDTMTGDLHFQPLTNLVLASRASIAYPAGQLTGEEGVGLAFNGAPVCLANVDIHGCGDITGITAGPGLTGGASVGSAHLAVAPGGITSDMIQYKTVGFNAVDEEQIQMRIFETCLGKGTMTDIGKYGHVECIPEALGSGQSLSVAVQHHASVTQLNTVILKDCEDHGLSVVVAGSVYVENLEAAGGPKKFMLKLRVNGINIGGEFRAAAHIPGGMGQTLAYTYYTTCGLGVSQLVYTQELVVEDGPADFVAASPSLTVTGFTRGAPGDI